MINQKPKIVSLADRRKKNKISKLRKSSDPLKSVEAELSLQTDKLLEALDEANDRITILERTVNKLIRALKPTN